jgi:hypothetical protein
VENVRKSSRFHRRCGTSFMYISVFISIIIFFFIRITYLPLRLLVRILMIPVVLGISYEILALAGKSENVFVYMLTAPGIWFQHLTTREPDDKMIEVAIKSVEAVFDWRKYLADNFGLDVNEDGEVVGTAPGWEEYDAEEYYDEGYEEDYEDDYQYDDENPDKDRDHNFSDESIDE